jgi:hypothetical protein
MSQNRSQQGLPKKVGRPILPAMTTALDLARALLLIVAFTLAAALWDGLLEGRPVLVVLRDGLALCGAAGACLALAVLLDRRRS